MRSKILIALLLVAVLVLTGCRHRNEPVADPAQEPQGEIAAKPSAGEPQSGEEPEEPLLPMMETSLSDYPLSTPTDDILVLVNKTHPVTRDYVADDLVTVEHCDQSVGNKDTKKMRKVAADAIEELIAGAKEDGFDIVMRTGYRSYDYQDYLFSSYAANYGEAEANTYSARPGQSEHQTGWCCDVGRPGYGLTSFDGTKEADWIAENCWKYGFILRYPADKTDITGYIYESWHIRYVGMDAAQYIYENGLTLEEYLGILD
ncbi:MAG: M15 family metallopeptidase [Firmicutes bacterium]|nr:M15 family metallopeptidase [Bacillota bacterium]